MSEKDVEIHSQKEVYTSKVFRLEEEDVTLPTGARTTFSCIRHPGAAAIVAITEDAQLLWLRQYRHAVGKYIIEIPAGTLDGSESPADCARRELVEETGFEARKWQPLGDILLAPGYSDEKIALFLAGNLVRAQQKLDRDEVLDLHYTPFSAALEMAQNGRLEDAKSIAGIMRAALVLKDFMA